jgi:hypothetical protein
VATTIQVVVDAKLKKEIRALAKAERRTLSSMAGWLLVLGKLKFYEQDLAKSKEGQAA